MAELTFFSFYPGSSLVHQLDARFKIFFVIVLSFICLNTSFQGLAALSTLITAFIFSIRLPLTHVIKELRYFLLLIVLVFVARTLSSDGAPDVNFRIFTISVNGLRSGLLICWRLAFIVFCGLAFISTTRSSQIKGAVQWYLKPIPFIPEKKIGTMMSLIMRFVPVILDQAKETLEAQKARGIENRKNPFYRLVKLGIPLIRRTFEQADDLVLALEARCYSDSRTNPPLRSHKRDWLSLLAIMVMCIALYVFKFI